jgi:dUTP pyrophosphatase
MKVRIKRIDQSLPLTVYETKGSVGFDLIVREDAKIESKAIALIPANAIIEVPEGYMLVVCSRSSTPRKKSLSLPHGIGIIDKDYCGDTDEIMIQVFNFTDTDVEIKRGDKIAQGIFVRVDIGEWDEVNQTMSEDRGGFGSTGE